MSPANRNPWFAARPNVTADLNRHVAINWFLAGMTAFATIYTIWYTASSALRDANDPVAPMAAISALVFGGQLLWGRRFDPDVRLAIMQGSTYLLAGTYIIWRFLLGNPFQGTGYILITVFAAVALARFRHALIYVAIAAIWLIAWPLVGIIENPVDLPATLLGVMVGGVVAYVIARERRRAADLTREWQAAHESLESVLRSVSEPIFSIDPEGCVQFANEAAEEWCQNVTKCRVETARFWRFLPTDARGHFENAYNAALSGRASIASIRMELGGESRHWKVVAEPHADLDGAILTVHDFIDEERHEHALADSRVQARKDMLNLVSHDLATPLMPILIESHVLTRRLEDLGRPEDLERIKTITRNARRAIDMVHHLIDESRELDANPQRAMAKRLQTADSKRAERPAGETEPKEEEALLEPEATADDESRNPTQ